MFSKLKGMFGNKRTAEETPKPKPKKSRVNLNRRYTFVADTAQGSMSRVYKAVDNQSGRSVCVKVQLPEKNLATAARAVREQRPDEGEMASQVVHPHVVRTLEYGLTTKKEHFVVMEFVEGQSLVFVRQSGSLPLEDKFELLAQSAEGLAAVHAAGFIHHDIGPRNFLINRDRQVKLIDFGLTVPNTPVFCRPGNRTGTLNYMAPELVRRETIDERIDIFSFGSMAFEFLTERLPYDSTTSMAAMLARINHDPLDPAKASPNLPAPVHDLLRKLTARRREDRWPSMSNLAETLRSLPTKR